MILLVILLGMSSSFEHEPITNKNNKIEIIFLIYLKFLMFLIMNPVLLRYYQYLLPLRIPQNQGSQTDLDHKFQL